MIASSALWRWCGKECVGRSAVHDRTGMGTQHPLRILPAAHLGHSLHVMAPMQHRHGGAMPAAMRREPLDARPLADVIPRAGRLRSDRGAQRRKPRQPHVLHVVHPIGAASASVAAEIAKLIQRGSRRTHLPPDAQRNALVKSYIHPGDTTTVPPPAVKSGAGVHVYAGAQHATALSWSTTCTRMEWPGATGRRHPAQPAFFGFLPTALQRLRS